ncbi:MAG: thioredoxin domain-containing protein [Candidatus Carbobacillus sp.]|nr:thioredoxin domain-containing protein [Candidatus Carbobacillus sp.]
MTLQWYRVLPLPFLLLLLSFIVLGCSPSSNKDATDARSDTPTAEPALRIEDLRQMYPHIGDPAARHTILLFADFKCPHCKAFEEEVFPRLRTTYVDTGKAELFYIPLPVLGGDAYTAAQAALAVYDKDPDAFWAYVQTLYAHQDNPSMAWATPSRLIELASSITPPINRAVIEQGLQNDTLRQAIEQAQTLAEHYGINSVPSLVIDGRWLKNAQGESDAFNWKAIEEALP